MADTNLISETIIALERQYNDRWSTGDMSGYLDAYRDDMSYFDPLCDTILIGRSSVVNHLSRLYKNPHIVRSEYLNPHVVVSGGGDLAVLSYNLNTFVADENGGERLLRAWNSTEVYRLTDGQWRIMHSNWALTKSLDLETAS